MGKVGLIRHVMHGHLWSPLDRVFSPPFHQHHHHTNTTRLKQDAHPRVAAEALHLITLLAAKFPEIVVQGALKRYHTPLG